MSGAFYDHDQYKRLDRIADALERIAAALEDAAKPTGSADEPLLQAALDWRDVAKQLEAGGFDGDDRRSQSARVIEVGQAIRIVRAALASAEPAEVDGAT